MPTRIVNEPLSEVWGQSLTLPATGTAETTPRVFPVPFGAVELLVRPVVAARWALTPRIAAAAIVDSTTIRPVLGRELARLQDPRDGAPLAIPLSTTTFLALGFTERIGGLWCDVGVANAVGATPVVATLTGGGWTALTVASDASASAGATLAVDGSMLWTAPAANAWPARLLSDAGPPYKDVSGGVKLHWLRLSASAGLTAGTSLTLLAARHRDGAVDVAAGSSGFMVAATEYSIPLKGEVGGIEMTTVSVAASPVTLTWIFKG